MTPQLARARAGALAAAGMPRGQVSRCFREAADGPSNREAWPCRAVLDAGRAGCRCWCANYPSASKNTSRTDWVAYLSALALLHRPRSVMDGSEASLARGEALSPSAGRNPCAEAWGIRDFRAIIPLERLRDSEGRQALAPSDAQEVEEGAVLLRAEADSRVIPRPCIGSRNRVHGVGSYSQSWFDRGTEVLKGRLLSLIADPPGCRVPARMPDARKRADAIAAALLRRPHGPDDRRVGARCIVGFDSGPPTSPSAQESNMQPFQTP